jgi:hypothetical protein
MKYCHKDSDIPSTPHWAILTSSQINIPGDERSRTNPGHGYPAETKYHLTYAAFDSEGAWKKEIERLTKYHETFTAVRVIPATVTVKVVTTIDVQ